MYNRSMVSLTQLKKNRFASLLGIGAVLALLLATLQVPVNTHWCSGKVFNRGIYTQASPCAMNTPKIDDRGVSFSGIPCCSNEASILAASGLDFDGPVTSMQNHSTASDFASVESVAELVLLAMGRSSLNGLPQGPPAWSAPDLYDLYQSYLI